MVLLIVSSVATWLMLLLRWWERTPSSGLLVMLQWGGVRAAQSPQSHSSEATEPRADWKWNRSLPGLSNTSNTNLSVKHKKTVDLLCALYSSRMVISQYRSIQKLHVAL